MVDMAVGRRISSLRVASGLSGRKLSRLIGREDSFVESIESGSIHPSISDVNDIARVLRVHPAMILEGEAGEGQASAKVFVSKYVPEFLREARFRRRLSPEQAAGALDVSVGELSAWESGSVIPGAGHCRRLSVLYGVDEKMLSELCAAEKMLPVACGRMARFEKMFRRFVAVLKDGSDNRDKLLEGLARDLDSCLADSGCVCERDASYFSIGHLSDDLLKALQDPEFHEKAETLAREFLENSAANPASGINGNVEN